MAQGFLLKYAEIGVKGKNRYKFEDALCDQIRLRLSGIDGDFTVQKESGRVFVQADGDFDFDEVIETLQRVFGLAGISRGRGCRGQKLGQCDKGGRRLRRETVR